VSVVSVSVSNDAMNGLRHLRHLRHLRQITPTAAVRRSLGTNTFFCETRSDDR